MDPRAIYCLVTILSALACTPASAQAFKGVNLAGAESQSSRIPGTYGRDYVFPKDSEISYFTGLGMNVFRVPVLWERLQPTLNGPLDPTEIKRLSGVIAAAQHRGAHVIIDVHNYGRYRGEDIGTANVPVAAFVGFWVKLAQVYGKNGNVLFGLMNEPQLKNSDAWRSALQQTIIAIRKSGAKNQILVSGLGWDGAHSFVKLNGASLGDLSDPDNRTIYEVHQYFDPNFSGTSPGCIDREQAVNTLTAFTAWLRVGHHQGFLGEFGVGRDPKCLDDLDGVLGYLSQNGDVWKGWTYWAAGPRWGNYMFTAEPINGQPRPQTIVLEKYLQAR